MSRLQRRGSIALAALAVALLGSTAADAEGTAFAEGIVDGWPKVQPGGLVSDMATGVQYDRKNKANAEWHLQCLQAKLRRDAERGNAAAVQRDARWIDNHRYRIAVDEWLIRKNSLQNPCYYPVRDVCVPDSWYGCVPQTPCPTGMPCRP